MADEIVVKSYLNMSKGGVTHSKALNTLSIDMAGDYAIRSVQAVGFAAHEALIIGEIGTVGWCWFKNLDATNFVEIGYDDAAAFKNVIKLKAGEECVVRLGQDDPYALADTAAVDLEYIIIED